MTKHNRGFAPIIILVVIAVAIGGWYLWSKRNSLPVADREMQDETVSWNSYSDNYAAFRFPSTWRQKELVSISSGYDVEFENSGNYRFSYSVRGNYNADTQSAYYNLDEYLGLPYTVETVKVNGAVGRKPLPRAGSENINEVVFLSLDGKNLITLKLSTGENSNIPVSEIENGQILFDQILSTFRLLVNNSDWVSYTNSNLGVFLRHDAGDTPNENLENPKPGEGVFIVSGVPNFNPDEIELCQDKINELDLCLLDKENGWQNNKIVNTTVGGIPAISFLVNYKLDIGSTVLHVIQTTGSPKIEIATSVDGFTLEEKFQTILSTVKFTQ